MVERSDIVFERPNRTPQTAMPLGNGRLGLAIWAEDGYTAQLNRGDTFPLRLSPGQVMIPGLKKLVDAGDYSARLNLYDGQFEERGGGMTSTTYVDSSLDTMVVEVAGADPNTTQTAELKLWPPRQPQVLSQNGIGILAETWRDDEEKGASGETFGSLAAITADAVDVKVERTGVRSVRITFRPFSDGSFRILVAAPKWRGGNPAPTAVKLLRAAKTISSGEHRAWWHKFWAHTGLLKLSSPDHAAEYFENLRMIDLFATAAESRGQFPGSQAGVGDLFSAFQDQHMWDPADFWHWNLRMQVDANLGAGDFALNAPYFRLYRDNLANILDWTKRHMGGRAGTCVPETMRFNGQGYENEVGQPPALDCDAHSAPFYNARTITTGAEVSLWIWRQYLYTDDLDFLRRNYPVMRESARFLLAYATHDKNGRLHTSPSNAHESQWDVRDPTTDIAAMRSLFPAVVEAAHLLKMDSVLAGELEKQITEVPQWPVVRIASPTTLVHFDAKDTDTILAFSYDPGAFLYNSENIGLESVWPYGLIGDDGPLHALGVRSFLHRSNQGENDWSFDPIQAARLGLTDEFKASLLALTQRYQAYPSGLAKFMGPEFYIEQIGVVADALANALVQDYDGLVRIAPAWPMDWDADATISIQHRSKIHLQIHKGKILTVGIESGANREIRIRNPWPGQSVEVRNARTNAIVRSASSADVLQFFARAGSAYTLQGSDAARISVALQAVCGERASAPKSLGSRTIGLFRRQARSRGSRSPEGSR